jgi:hypothetical protein
MVERDISTTLQAYIENLYGDEVGSEQRQRKGTRTLTAHQGMVTKASGGQLQY